MAHGFPKLYGMQFKGSKFTASRQTLDLIPVHGVLDTFEAEGYGFLAPDVDLSHIMRSSSKIFVHRNDMDFEPEVGQRVQFFLYQDAKGLGAHTCRLEGSSPDPTNMERKVVPMAIPNKLLGPLIGRKGITITALMDECNVEISIPQHDRDNNKPNDLKVVTFRGTRDALKYGIKETTRLLTGFSTNTFNSKVLFLVPRSATGIFIGRGGSCIKKCVGAEKNVSLTISKGTMMAQGTVWHKAIFFGPAPAIERCMDNVVEHMCNVYDSVMEIALHKKRGKREKKEVSSDLEDSEAEDSVDAEEEEELEDKPAESKSPKTEIESEAVEAI